MLRDLHRVAIYTAPPLGPNPFVGGTQAQARAAIRNDPARWHDGQTSGLVEVNLNENSENYTLGSDEARFELHLDYPGGSGAQPGAEKIVCHYRDRIGKIGLVTAAAEHPESFADLTSLPISNRVEYARPGTCW